MPQYKLHVNGAVHTVEAVADTVVARVLDHLGVEHDLVHRWGEEPE